MTISVKDIISAVDTWLDDAVEHAEPHLVDAAQTAHGNVARTLVWAYLETEDPEEFYRLIRDDVVLWGEQADLESSTVGKSAQGLAYFQDNDELDIEDPRNIFS